jgi:hypothetical protein
MGWQIIQEWKQILLLGLSGFEYRKKKKLKELSIFRLDDIGRNVSSTIAVVGRKMILY